MVLEITGNATVLQPRPPSNNAQSSAVVPGKKRFVEKPGRKLKDPRKTPDAAAITVVASTILTKPPTKITEIVSGKILERFSHVGEAFLAFDRDRSGTITEGEIKLGLHNFGFDLSEQALKDICSRFRHNEAGLIDYKSFSDYFASTLEGSGSLKLNKHKAFVDPRHKTDLIHSENRSLNDVVDAVEIELRKKLAEQFRTVRHAFLFFDQDRSGRIMMDEFKRVLNRYGIELSNDEMLELKRRTEMERAAEQLAVPARKKRDTIFSSFENEDDEAVAAAKAKDEKMKDGIRYEDFVRHFGKVLQPNYAGDDGDDFHNQDNRIIKRGKNVGHSASHKIFGSKATATEGKKAQKSLAAQVFHSLDELHDAFVFHDRHVTGILAQTIFAQVLSRFGTSGNTIQKLSTKYNFQDQDQSMTSDDNDDTTTTTTTPTTNNNNTVHVNYTKFFSVLCDTVGSTFASHFAEDQIVLQIDIPAKGSRLKIVPADSIEKKCALELAVREGLPRVISTWKLFDRAGSGKIQGGEFINALRNTRAGRKMPQRGATALAELYDLDGTGRCDYVAFSRSFRKDLVDRSRHISRTAAMRKGSLLVNTTRKAADFWIAHASKQAADKLEAQSRVENAYIVRKRGLILPDSKIHKLNIEKKKSPRFRASFDTHNLVKQFRSELTPYWKSLTKAFRTHDKRNTGYVSPSRFAKIILSKTTAIPKAQVERLALAFVDFKEQMKPRVSYNRFMKQLVLEPMRPQADGRPRRPMTRPTPKTPGQVTTVPSARPTTTSYTPKSSGSMNTELSSPECNEISRVCMFSIYGRWKELRRIFAKMDTKRTGRVCTSSFCETLQKNAYAVTQQDYAAIRKRFGNNGKIRYHDFLRHALTNVQNDATTTK